MAERIVATLLWIGFAALVLTVGMQVLARNVLHVPMVWTLDLAQLLFAWLIFVGAAIAYRRGVHYRIDLLPEGWTRAGTALDILGALAALIVVFVLVRYGWMLTGMRATSRVQALGLSEAWFYAAIPTSGALMGLFLVERVIANLTDRRRGHDAA